MAQNSPGSLFSPGDGNPIVNGFLNPFGGALGQFLFGNQDFIPDMVNELSGFNSQQREFEQQDKLLEKQQEFADERNQMRRMTEAGINPLTAAANISGQSPSAPLVPESSGAPAAGLNAVSGAAQSVGSIADNISAARERNSLLEERKKNLISDTFLKYKEAGYDDAMAKNLAIANAFLSTEKFLGLVTMSENINNLRGEYKVMMQDIENKKKQIQEMDAQISLYKAQGNMADALALQANRNALLLESQRIEQDWYNNKRKELGIDIKSPLENQIFMLGITSDSRYESSLGIVRDVKYNESIGEYNADRDTAYDRAYEAGRAAYDFNWDSPPKTIAEFLWKGVGNIKENLRQIVSNLFKPSSNKLDKPVEPSIQELRQSFLQYRQGLDNQYAMLNMMRSELADRLAAGENLSQTVDLRIEINKLNAELSKMPQTFDDFKKYVKKHH